MEDWQEKTVSMDNVDMAEFDTDLAHVRVSENRIHVEFKDHEDWKRIRREVGDEKILREVEWREVRDVDASTEHLYFMHIDLDVADPDGEGTVERRLYFLEDDEEAMEDCRAAIERFWNAWRQKQAVPSGDYSYSDADGDAGTGEDVALAEAVEEDGGDRGEEDAGQDERDEEDASEGDDAGGDARDGEDDGGGDADSEGEEPDDDDGEDDRGIEDIVKDFLP